MNVPGEPGAKTESRISTNRLEPLAPKLEPCTRAAGYAKGTTKMHTRSSFSVWNV